MSQTKMLPQTLPSLIWFAGSSLDFHFSGAHFWPICLTTWLRCLKFLPRHFQSLTWFSNLLLDFSGAHSRRSCLTTWLRWLKTKFLPQHSYSLILISNFQGPTPDGVVWLRGWDVSTWRWTGGPHSCIRLKRVTIWDPMWNPIWNPMRKIVLPLARKGSNMNLRNYMKQKFFALAQSLGKKFSHQAFRCTFGSALFNVLWFFTPQLKFDTHLCQKN